VVGVDAVPALVAQARARRRRILRAGLTQAFESRFHCRPCGRGGLQFLSARSDSVESMLAALPGYLRGQVVCHTNAASARRLRRSSLSGRMARRHLAGLQFRLQGSAPWYFRTLESWFCMLRRCGFELLDLREPTIPVRARRSRYCSPARHSRRVNEKPVDPCFALLPSWTLSGCVIGYGPCLFLQPVKHTFTGLVHFRDYPASDGIDNVRDFGARYHGLRICAGAKQSLRCG